MILHIVNHLFLVVKISIHFRDLCRLFSLLVPDCLPFDFPVFLLVLYSVLFAFDVISQTISFCFHSHLLFLQSLKSSDQRVYTLLATLTEGRDVLLSMVESLTEILSQLSDPLDVLH